MTPYWILSMNTVVVLVAFSVFSSLTASEICPVRLPQDESSASCAAQREKEISYNRDTYKLKSKPKNPHPRVDLSMPKFDRIIAKDAFVKSHKTKYFSMLRKVTAIAVLKLIPIPISSMEFYAKIRQDVRKRVQGYIGENGLLPSDFEPFQNKFTTWIGDEFFAQQRLAGVNPLSLQRVSIRQKKGFPLQLLNLLHNGKETVGLDWDKLKKELNPRFDWERAVQRALRVHKNLEEIIASGLVYALRYHMCDNLPKQKIDLTDPMRSALTEAPMSPIALFVSSSDASGSLKPVAIQTDYKPDSPVYTPQDGDDWMLAKLNVQITDLAYSQIVEHLVRSHYFGGILSVITKRSFSSKHPIRQMMKYHNRGVLVTNVFGTPTLTIGVGFMAALFEMGDEGAKRLSQDAYPISWNITDFRGNLEKRGMQDKRRIPYYPYRDDGEKIYEAIEDFVKEYVDHYYANDDDVKKDKALQAFAKEVSAKIKDFPSQIHTVDQLKEILTRWIWQLVGHHTSVNYGLADYMSYVPNMPTKTYKNPPLFKNRKFDYYNLGRKKTTTVQCAFTMALACFRYDRLLDYGHMMDDKEAGNIVNRHHSRLMSDVEAILEKRNEERLAAGQLTYPNMLPKWLPNGIQA